MKLLHWNDKTQTYTAFEIEGNRIRVSKGIKGAKDNTTITMMLTVEEMLKLSAYLETYAKMTLSQEIRETLKRKEDNRRNGNE